MDLDELKKKLENSNEVVYPTGNHDKRERMAEPTDDSSGLNIPIVTNITFKLTLDDGYCVWEYPITPTNIEYQSIRNVHEKICEGLNAKKEKGRRIKSIAW